MSPERKAAGIGLLIAITMSLFAGMSATASTGGHFYMSSGGVQLDHPTIKVTENGEHTVHLASHGLGGQLGCTTANYETTFNSGKLSTAEVFPAYAGCTTTGSSNMFVTTNGCSYVFKVAASTVDETEQTADLKCPKHANGEQTKIEVHHPNCTVTIPPQTNIGKITYTTDEIEGRKTLTSDVEAEFETEFHGGICVFTGTAHTGTLDGVVTVEAVDTEGNRIDLTAT